MTRPKIGEVFNRYRVFHNILVPHQLLGYVGRGEQLLYGIVCRYMGKDGYCFPSQSRLARDLRTPRSPGGVSIRTVHRLTQNLVKAGLIRATRRGAEGRRTYCYECLWHEVFERGQMPLVYTDEPSPELRFSSAVENSVEKPPPLFRDLETNVHSLPWSEEGSLLDRDRSVFLSAVESQNPEANRWRRNGVTLEELIREHPELENLRTIRPERPTPEGSHSPTPEVGTPDVPKPARPRPIPTQKPDEDGLKPLRDLIPGLIRRSPGLRAPAPPIPPPQDSDSSYGDSGPNTTHEGGSDP